MERCRWSSGCCRYYDVALRSLGLALGAFALFAVPQLTPERYVHHPWMYVLTPCNEFRSSPFTR